MREHREIRSLTGLRGVAAAYVVVQHFFLGLTFTKPFTTFLAHGYLPLTCFFVVSGFVTRDGDPTAAQMNCSASVKM
jgi:peptidoglycan/LPS O-acetylase OafA/YrhL